MTLEAGGFMRRFLLHVPPSAASIASETKGFWMGLFGHIHGVMMVSAFYENVSRHRMEQRELAPGEKDENVVLEFRPTPHAHCMFVAALDRS
jgi:hypothetical protein